MHQIPGAENLPVQSSGVTRVAVSGPLIAREAEQIHSTLVTAIRGAQTVIVDCADAAQIDLSFLQLLLAARKSAAAQGKTVALAEPASGALLTAVRQAGFIPSRENEPGVDTAFWLGEERPND